MYKYAIILFPFILVKAPVGFDKLVDPLYLFFQDYKVHQDEIHSKLVQIMRERLLVHLRGLQSMFQSWNKVDDTDAQPSQFARSLTKVSFIPEIL